MDPNFIGPEQWGQLGRALTNLLVFLGLAVNGALAFLFGHAIIPSLLADGEAPRQVQTFRWVFYAVSATSIAVMLVALGRALYLAVSVLQYIYPRFAI